MSTSLHLVMKLDLRCSLARQRGPESLCRNAILWEHAAVVLSLLTRRLLRAAREHVRSLARLDPNTWVTPESREVHAHRGKDLDQEDATFTEAVSSALALPCDNHSLDARALPVMYLGATGETPRPRVIVGHSEQDTELLSIADHPVVDPPADTPKATPVANRMCTMKTLMAQEAFRQHIDVPLPSRLSVANRRSTALWGLSPNHTFEG